MRAWAGVGLWLIRDHLSVQEFLVIVGGGVLARIGVNLSIDWLLEYEAIRVWFSRHERIRYVDIII